MYVIKMKNYAIILMKLIKLIWEKMKIAGLICIRRYKSAKPKILSGELYISLSWAYARPYCICNHV